MASKNSSGKSEDDDEVWTHRPLKRVRKSEDQFSPSQQNSAPSSRSTPRPRQVSGIPQSQCGVTPSPRPRPSQLRTSHQSRRKIFDSSQKSTKSGCASQPRRTSANKSGKMQHQIKKEMINTKIKNNPDNKKNNNINKCETGEKLQKCCPICQAPFSSIHLRSPGEHIQDCLELPKPDNECPGGQSCNITILSHYEKFSHNLLALVRSLVKPDDSSMMDEDNYKPDKFTSLKAEVMTSDSDFEIPSSSKPAAAANCLKPDKFTSLKAEVMTSDSDFEIPSSSKPASAPSIHPSRCNPHGAEVMTSDSDFEIPSSSKPAAAPSIHPSRCNPHGDYECKIEGDRVMCTPKKQCSSQIAPSQPKSKLKNTARKSAKGAINRNQRTMDRMLAVKKEMPTPKLEILRESETSCTENQKSISKDNTLKQDPDQSILTLEQKPSGALFNGALHSPLSNLEINVTFDQSSVSEGSQPFVESDMDIFASGESEPECRDQNNFNKTKSLTPDNAGSKAACTDEFVKLKPKQDMKRVPGDPQSVANDVDKLIDEHFFNIQDDAADEGSESLFSTQNSNFEEDDAMSRNRPKKSNPPNFIEVPPAPIQDDDDDTTLEEFCVDANGDENSDIAGQGSKSDGEVKGQETLEDESQKEETESPINTSDKNKEIVLSLDHREGKVDQAVVFSEDEDSQSLFNIPGKNKEGQLLTVSNLPGKSDDAAECSEDGDEDMEVDDEDEEIQNKEERPSVSGWGTSDARSAMSAKDEEYSRQSNVHDTSTSTPAVTPKPKKQGTLDSFFGCKPAPKLEPPSQKIQQKGQWRGPKQTYKRNKGEGDGKKEWGNSSGKECPFYKKMPDTSFTVDAFRYSVIPGCKAYFLSHFHYDHYGGLTKHFDQQLYCSRVTGNLVISRLKVAAEYVKILPMNTPCNVDGVEVTLLDANHCPGAVMFLYKLKSGVIYLHTGDFRADVKMELYPELSHCHVSQLYLDTTYCDPQYKFPSQTEVIEFAVKTAVQAVRLNKKTLIVCATYTIGKEKVFRAIAEALECKVYVESQKFKVLECLEDDDLMSLLTLDNKASTCRLHVIGMNMLNHQKLKEYLSQFSSRYDNILAFKPTGWTHSDKVESPSDIKPSKSGKSTIYGIPYSEHSSYSEMKRFVQFISADKILPTVNNGNPKSRKAMEDIFKRWMGEDGRSSSPTRLKSVKIKNWFK